MYRALNDPLFIFIITSLSAGFKTIHFFKKSYQRNAQARNYLSILPFENFM